MSTKFKLKKGSLVSVIAGNHRGQQGKVLDVSEKGIVRVEGVHVIKKTLKRSAKNPQGGLIEREGPIHISNVRAVAEESK